MRGGLSTTERGGREVGLMASLIYELWKREMSADLLAMAGEIARRPPPTEAEIIAGGVAFVMGPCEGTRRATMNQAARSKRWREAHKEEVRVKNRERMAKRRASEKG
jgi:hypothetical protein